MAARILGCGVTTEYSIPRRDEFEVSLLGLGYGESILVHVGEGEWLVVDCYLSSNGLPAALNYLYRINVDPATAVKLVVATHWHDDHIRGMNKLIVACSSAYFCCASALNNDEFLGVASALRNKDCSDLGRGVREIYEVFSTLKRDRRQPIWAISNRIISKRERYEIWSLSPFDSDVKIFLKSVSEPAMNPQ